MESYASEVQKIKSAYHCTLQQISDVEVRTKSLFCIMPEHINIILKIKINVKQRSVITKQCSVYKCTDRKTTYNQD